MEYPYNQKDMEKIDSIITNLPLKINRKFKTNPFRKKWPIEGMNVEALPLQENRYKNFTATPINNNNNWSKTLFPPRNILTKRNGPGRSLIERSTSAKSGEHGRCQTTCHCG